MTVTSTVVPVIRMVIRRHLNALTMYQCFIDFLLPYIATTRGQMRIFFNEDQVSSGGNIWIQDIQLPIIKTDDEKEDMLLAFRVCVSTDLLNYID